jgi:mono/diheme cytochrome c family protein
MLGVMLLMSVGCGRGRKGEGKEASFQELATRKQIGGLSREQLAGKPLYDHYCAVCHGKTGKGDGFNAFNIKDSLGIAPADLSGAAAPPSLDRLKQIITQGGPSAGKSKYMPPWGGTLAEPQIHLIARYVQSFRQPETAAPASTHSGNVGR